MTNPRFGIFDHIEDIPGTPTSQLFKDRLELIKMADQAGFYGYHLAEHHGGELCLAPSQEIFIAAASQITERIRLGPMVKLLPMHHPMRIIEDMCIVDQLTEGRLEFGVGRGAVPVEHHWFGDRWEGSRERMVDILGIIHRALETGEVSSEDSRYYDFPPMPMATRPYQERIPFWYPGSPETAGRHGMSLMWPGKIDEAAYEQYLRAWEDHKDDPIRMEGSEDQPRVGYSLLLAIAPTETEAREIAQRGMDGLIRRTRESHRFDHLVVDEAEGYAAQGALRAIIANMDMAIQFGAGTPDQIAERLALLLEDGMADYLCFMFPAGDMSFAESRRTLELFVTKVQPQLQGSAVPSHG
ncbi:MAG: LLM class flavin-dependent oxidoreductase [Solirubrobacterales bacterium]|nr:LLM class flavin-dependent oxidoreductase [Solirubrobacterales bacterium]MBV9714216.1 LLM class flavin-dependent oxidoreductase [Solirubrobacterales bacterium]